MHACVRPRARTPGEPHNYHAPPLPFGHAPPPPGSPSLEQAVGWLFVRAGAHCPTSAAGCSSSCSRAPSSAGGILDADSACTEHPVPDTWRCPRTCRLPSLSSVLTVECDPSSACRPVRAKGPGRRRGVETKPFPPQRRARKPYYRRRLLCRASRPSATPRAALRRPTASRIIPFHGQPSLQAH